MTGASASLEPVFHRMSRGDWGKPRRDRDARLFVVISRGFGLAEIEGRRLLLRAGSVLLIPLGVPYSIRFCRGAEGWRLRVMETLLLGRVTLALPEPAPSVREMFLAPRVVRFWEGKAMQSAREQMLGELGPVSRHLTRGFEGAVVSYLMVLLFGWSDVPINYGRVIEDLPYVRDDADGKLMARFRVLVEARFREHWTVAAYCQALDVPKSRLNRACADLARRSPLEIVHERLMLEAQRELAFSDAPIADVARSLGFGDADYFRRFFSKRLRTTPAQFRASRAPAREPIPAARARAHKASGRA